MSITYEEALTTLSSMFGAPWSRESLDAVLRHHEGHMENTVESVLMHGDGRPEDLVQKLQNGDVTAGGGAPNDDIAHDEEIARQLADEEQRGSAGRAPASAASRPVQKGRGTPTELPADFLRIPGRNDGGNVDADEALARMLQDELFTQELANNPEFAHLARGRRSAAAARNTGAIFGPANSSRHTSSTAAHYPARGGGHEGPGVLDALAELGESAKRRLALLAARFNANGAAPGRNESGERRGLLDDNDGSADEEISFSNRHENDVEMRHISSPGGKKID